MFASSLASSALFAGLAAAIPAPQGYGSSSSATTTGSAVVAADQSGNVAGYTNADAPYVSEEPTPLTVVPTSFGMDSQVSAIYTTAPTSGSGAAAPQRSEYVNGMANNHARLSTC